VPVSEAVAQYLGVLRVCRLAQFAGRACKEQRLGSDQYGVLL
jgi:hypothetical protein